MRLYRAHGLGNDYLVLEQGPALSPKLVRAVCDRHKGIGADGILEPSDAGEADYGLRIWNPDGSLAEKSGNGLRIFARWLIDRRGAPNSFTIWTGTDKVACELTDAIAIEMGVARFAPDEVPYFADRLHRDFEGVAVSIGNPHCVMFRDGDLDELPWRQWGEALEVHPAFPNRTNVQIARVSGPRAIEIRIWERGAGATEASGSSSCAAAAVAVKTGRLEPGRIDVHMPGGTLQVTVRPDFSIRLAGPVEVLGIIEVVPRWLRTRTKQ
jgi:diaminopimelate epimerase